MAQVQGGHVSQLELLGDCTVGVSWGSEAASTRSLSAPGAGWGGPPGGTGRHHRELRSAACRRAAANGAVAVAAGRPPAARWSPPGVLCPSGRG